MELATSQRMYDSDGGAKISCEVEMVEITTTDDEDLTPRFTRLVKMDLPVGQKLGPDNFIRLLGFVAGRATKLERFEIFFRSSGWPNNVDTSRRSPMEQKFFERPINPGAKR